MALSHAVGVRNTFADAVDAAVNVSGPGDMVLLAGVAEASRIPLNNPAFGNASNGDIVLDNTGPPEDSNATGDASPVDSFEFRDGTDALVFDGAVPGDLTLSKATIAPGDVVQLTSFTYSASP